ncbi:hypothetical protein FHN90_26150 [Shigella sonnei]|nr:hypothetical protein [Escherichia coli]EFC2091910.1 hypothetical protein [Escherichia coli]EFW7479073.1 hypothetical protein [Shigella sonnei]
MRAESPVVPETRLTARGIRCGQWHYLVFQFPVREPRQPDGCKLKTAPVRPVVAARPAEYVCSENLFYEGLIPLC